MLSLEVDYNLMQGEKKIEKYQFSLKKLLGQGSYAAVYLGRAIDGGEPVAVKVIDKKIFSNAYNVKNIQSQIDIMKKVSHENIVRLHDIYQTANNMYIVTELCPDGDLLRLLQKRKRLPEQQAKAYLRDIMAGAKYLHKNGIIHRDLKPANILLKAGSCKLSDFGFAKSLAAEETVMKSIVGTPLYMSPQILKKAKYTAKSDLWSIGLIYYEMLHGRTPWPANNEIELINGIYHKKILFATGVSDESKDFIRRCLEIYEEDRISWEEAFNHKLLLEEVKPKPTLDLQKLRQDKQNNCNFTNKVCTPTNPRQLRDQPKSPNLSFKTRKENKDPKDLKELKEGREGCMTPKGRMTPKNDRSGLKTKGDLTAKKEKDGKDTSTVKKRIVKEPLQLDEQRHDKFKLY